ncbi:MAG: pentapeptide repeat-containing protein, partial [Bacteroidota bacterium]
GRDVILEDCLFTGCSMNGTILLESKIINCEFTNCKLSGIEIDNEIINCIFESCSFFEAQLNGNKIANTSFLRCDFSSLSLSYCEMSACKYIENYNYTLDLIEDNTEVDVIWTPSPFNKLSIDDSKKLFKDLEKVLINRMPDLNKSQGWIEKSHLVEFLRNKDSKWEQVHLNSDHITSLGSVIPDAFKIFEFKAGEGHPGYIRKK